MCVFSCACYVFNPITHNHSESEDNLGKWQHSGWSSQLQMNVERLRDGFRVEVSIGLGLGSGSVSVVKVREGDWVPKEPRN